MKLKKSIFSGVIAVVLASSSACIVSADSKQISVPDAPIYKEARQADIQVTEPLKARRLDPSLDRIQRKAQKEPKSKIAEGLQHKYDKGSSSEALRVKVALNYDASEEAFEQELDRIKVPYQKIKYMTYEATINQEQAALVAGMQEVMQLSDATVVDKDFLTGEPVDDDSDYTTLNAATEMTGTKKARTDYGETVNAVKRSIDQISPF